MLYKLDFGEHTAAILEPLGFTDLSGVGGLEKDLENLLADHLLDVLYGEAQLMTIFQERQRQSEADLYALNQEGDLVIFELKLGVVGEDAVHQLLRYAQDAGQWTFAKLEAKYDIYVWKNEQEKPSLADAHRDAFELERALEPGEFNRRQHLRLIGSAADEKLIDVVTYWNQQSLSISFAPYRIYEIAGEYYFEFFSAPYDQHTNPKERKGVLFDTNRAYNEDSVWDMIEKKRIAAYGDRKDAVESVKRDDIVFYSHKGYGIVAAARVIGAAKHGGREEKYHDVEFLTPVPDHRSGIEKSMKPSEVKAVMGKNFYWRRIDKRPYLTSEEAETLLDELLNRLS